MTESERVVRKVARAIADAHGVRGEILPAHHVSAVAAADAILSDPAFARAGHPDDERTAILCDLSYANGAHAALCAHGKGDDELRRFEQRMEHLRQTALRARALLDGER